MPFLRSRWAESYFDWLFAKRKTVYFLFFVMTSISIFFTARLKLKTDFAALLPDRLPSVQNLHKVTGRIGGTGALLIGAESPSFAANKKFMNALSEKLEPLNGVTLRYHEYKYLESRDYLYKYGLHYLSNEQLATFHNFVENTIVKEKDKSVGSFLGLDEPEEKPAQKTSTLEGLNPQLQGLLRYPDAYLGSPDGKILTMFVRPLSSSLGVGKNREILGQIKDIVASLDPKSYHPEMHVGYGGNVVSSIDEVETVQADLLDTALILVALILTALFIFLWSFRLIFLICSVLGIAVAWTFALTQIFIGYLNTQTAFLGSLVVGTGINYGVIFVCRFLENRRAGLDVHKAVVEALRDTIVATLVASSTTAIAFVSLFLAENKGLSQFGFIGSIGVVLTWFLSFTILPLWLYTWELRKPTPPERMNPLAAPASRLMTSYANWVIKKYKIVLIITVALSLVSIAGAYKLFKDPLESNFDNLRNRITKDVGVAAFEKKMQSTLPTSRTPAPVMLESDAEAAEICSVVENIAKQIPEDKQMIHMCMSLYKMMPEKFEWTPERKHLFEKIQKSLKNPLIKFSDHADNLFGIRDKLSYTPPSIDDMPDEIKIRFREKDGTTGRIAFISPRPDKTLSDAKHLFDFVRPLKEFTLPSSNRVVSAAGDSFVLADLFASVHRDALVVGISAFIGVVLIAMFLAGGFWAGLTMCLCLSIGTLWMLGLQGFVGIKFNFFNFIALPLTFGIGIDYPINIFIRCRQENFQNYSRILLGSGVAVILCSITTIIGYLTLLEATNQALISFAILALIGETTCLVTAVFVLPAILRYRGKFKEA